ncbi:MAG: arginine--tRNA ligase [Candidatus Omnitrophota bacterium]|nr:MAG: arginine--tRNA ligase [Candidatus Omnitrophota bacterium]
MDISQLQKKLRLGIQNALKNIPRKVPPEELPSPLKIELEIPKDYKHGDLTTNVAMRLAKNFSLSNVKLAGAIKDELCKLFAGKDLGRIVSRIEVSAPGFINFWFSREYLHNLLSQICKEKNIFGKNDFGKGMKVNIEFVSANPTGPLTIAHGRQAAVGDALGRILKFSGYRVSKEYFINDVGTQVELLGKSIYSRYLSINGIESEFPENGYHGEYIKEIAEELTKKYGKKCIEESYGNLRFISQFGVKYILDIIESDLKRFGVFFDKWFSQEKLSPRRIGSALDKLKAKGYIYEKDGATWFKSTSFGDDKDRVVIKRDGAFTYLAPDIAYHLNKYSRRFHRLIDIWGPDHHGYIPRLTAAVEALGFDRDSISILIVQLATLFRNGVALSMSTRKGEFITLREVMDEVGCDVAKFFFLMRKLDSHLDFDLGLAKKNSLDNPVYYIQYAHARIASILGFSKGLGDRLKNTTYNPHLLESPASELLLRMLCQFPLVIKASAKMLEPYKVIDYLNELAKVFHNFYTKHRVVSDTDLPLTKARLTLVSGIKAVLANGLRLLGVSLPERM